MPILVSCPVCKKTKKVKPYKLKITKNFFCSKECKSVFQKGKPTWNKGKKTGPMSESQKQQIRETVLKNPKIKLTQFQKGHTMSESEKQKRKTTIQKSGTLSGSRNGMAGRFKESNPNWKGGISYWRKQYYNSIEYRDWQKKVFERDNYKCQICGVWHTTKNIIHAHHIRQFALYPELRTELSNGITVCKKCHMGVHSKKIPTHFNELGKQLWELASSTQLRSRPDLKIKIVENGN